MGRLVSTALVSLTALVALIAPAGCSAHGDGELPVDDLGLVDLEVLPQGRLWEPAPGASAGDLDYRVVPPSRESKQLKQSLGKGKRVVYINGQGGTYTPGWDDAGANKSSIIDGTVKISAYREGAQAWTELKTCLTKEYARWNVTITDVDPGQVPHVEAVIGGKPGAVGLPQSVGGVAPMASNGSVIERAVVYVFADNLKNAQYECEVAAHEIGHAFGLEHEYLCADPMTYLEGCGHKTFQDKAAYCGTDSAVKCRNGGKQNTVEHLTGVLGLAKPGGNDEPDDDEDDDQDSAP
ncbi:MAG: zinc-dependent metalloprotease family protein, partial [Polyangiales bacterium]